MTTSGIRVGTKGAAVAVALLLLAGCGSSGSKGAAPTTAANPARDKAAAQKLVLALADMPTGWIAAKHSTDPSDAAENKKLAACVGATDPSVATANVDGPDLDHDTTEIQSSVTVMDTRAHFLTDAKALQSSKFVSCAETIFKADLPKSLAKNSPGVVVSNIKVAPATFAKVGEVTAAFRVSLTLTGSGRTLPLYLDEVEFGSNRSEVSITFLGQSAPVASALEQATMSKAAAKLAKSAA